MRAPVPANEQERLQALQSSGILDTVPERSYDQLTELAASVCGTPVAILSLIDSDRQWFKSRVGLTTSETSRDIAFCAHTILQRDLLVVPDATADDRFADNPFVTSEPHIRFYAGAPLITPEGHALGTLCVLDYVPRKLTEQQCEALRVLSSQAIAQIELRKTKAELKNAESSADSAIEALRASEEFKSRLLACSRDCIKVLDLEGRLVYMNEGGMQSLEICDLAPVLNSSWIDFWEGQDREAARAAVETASRGEIGRFAGFFATRITNQPRWWDVVVSPILDGAGKPERILALSRDVTAQKLSEDALRDAMQFNRAIIQDAGEGIAVYDRELRYKVFNPYMERLTGKRAEEVLGKVALEVFPRLRTNGIEALLKRALAGEVVKISDVLIPKHSAQGADVWESCTYAPQYDGEGNIIGVIALLFDVTDRHVAEETFRAIVVGTASSTGGDFFPSLVKHMAAALRVRYAFITACDDGKHAKALAFWKGDRFGENFEFDVAGTPCLKVVQGEICHYRDRLVQLFPLDTPLAELGAESYLGVPMLDQSGRVIGHIAIIDDKPMERDERAIDLVKIFAARAAAELKRKRAEADLQNSLERVGRLEQRNRMLLEINNALVNCLTEQELLRAISESFKGMIPFDNLRMSFYDPTTHSFRTVALAFGSPVGRTVDENELSRSGSDPNWALFLPNLETNCPETPYGRKLFNEGYRSFVGVPVVRRGETLGSLAIASRTPDQYTEETVLFLQEIAGQIAIAVANLKAFEEITSLKAQLQAENLYLQEEIRKEHNFEEIVGNSKGLLDVLRKVETVAPTDSTVLILGETGCGKELIARAIHNRSKRKNRPLVKVNCGAIPTGLVESELFGHMKGAFTGALERRTGRFELADGGSLFLDEISELPLDTQVKLLRVLQEHEFEPLGSSRTIKVNVRIIAASNRDLDKAVQEGRFRADLFYRLNVLPITLPPLRERRADIPLLASFFVERFSRQFGKPITGISQDTMDLLARYSWPGNIRELQNVIERAVVLCSGTVLPLGKDLLPVTSEEREEDLVSTSASFARADSPSSLESVERAHILQVLQETRGIIEGPRGAARILNLHPNTLRSRMKKLGIERPIAQANPSAANNRRAV